MEIKANTSQKARTITYRTNHTPVKAIQTKASRREVRSGRTPVNVTINKVGDDSLGWGKLVNNVHTVTNKYPFTGGVPFVLPIRNDGGLTDQAPDAIKQLIDNDTNKLTVSNINDMILLRLQFMVSAETALQEGGIYFNIGTPKVFNFESFTTGKSAGDGKPITMLLLFFQKNVFEANGAEVICTVNDDGEMWDIECVPIKLYNGKESI